nr:VOC family protein [Streptomyces sp. CS227]
MTAAEGARLHGAGGPGRSWVVMADPEGNEFDVLRTPAP